MTRLQQSAQVTPRIIVDDYREVNPGLEVLLDRVDGRDLPLQGHVEDVSATQRPQADLVAWPQFTAVDSKLDRDRNCSERVEVFSHDGLLAGRQVTSSWFHGDASVDLGQVFRFAPIAPSFVRRPRPPGVSRRLSGSRRGA